MTLKLFRGTINLSSKLVALDSDSPSHKMLRDERKINIMKFFLVWGYINRASYLFIKIFENIFYKFLNKFLNLTYLF